MGASEDEAEEWLAGLKKRLPRESPEGGGEPVVGDDAAAKPEVGSQEGSNRDDAQQAKEEPSSGTNADVPTLQGHADSEVPEATVVTGLASAADPTVTKDSSLNLINLPPPKTVPEED